MTFVMILEHGELQKLHINDIHLGGVVHRVIEKKSGLMIWDCHRELQCPDSAHASVYKPGNGERSIISKHLIKKEAMTKSFI